MYGNLIFLYIFKIITVHYFYCPYFIIPSNFVKLVFENNKLKNKQTIQISGLILQYCSAITLYLRLLNTRHTYDYSGDTYAPNT